MVRPGPRLRRTALPEVVLAHGVALRPSGRALRGFCPLPRHDDRCKPNFYVYPDQSWYCYRCCVGGDVITFIKERHGLDFAGACAYLDGHPVAAVAAVIAVSGAPPATHPSAARVPAAQPDVADRPRPDAKGSGPPVCVGTTQTPAAPVAQV